MPENQAILERLERQEKNTWAFIKCWLGILWALIIAWIWALFSAFINLHTSVEIVKVKIDQISSDYNKQYDNLNERIDELEDSMDKHINITNHS